ncbi:MAG: insulinase family protein [Oscillospiraceae bacterium]|nr:insulinase family protein [Oscillospiraceae bacterium]
MSRKMTEYAAADCGEGSTENGLRYTALCSPKFRSCLLTFYFYVHRTPETAPVHALLTDLLTASSVAYPDHAALSLRLESLYAADFSAKLSLCGDDAALVFTASWLDDRYALNGEAVTEQVLELVLGCLLRPNAENGAFCDPAFRICKQNLLDDIDCLCNDKREYALQQAAAVAYQGTPAEISVHGSRAAAETVTPEQAYKVWQEILRTSFAEIVCVTPEPKPEIREKVLGALNGLSRDAAFFSFDAPGQRKAAPALQTEAMPLEQSKLVLVYRYDDIPREVLAVLCGVLGGIPESLLFLNLREKQGLCYYCALQSSQFKHTVTIDCGIDAEQAETVQRVVAEQLRTLQSGGFPEEMMRQAVLQYEYHAAAVQDALDSTASAAAAMYRRRDLRTPEMLAAAMRQVTREQIAAAAAQLTPDTVYLLRAEDGEEADADAG